jgi:ubiquinone/menaquinone biosynthesis C-methylase UbiE
MESEYTENPQKADFPDFYLVYRRWAKKHQMKDPSQIAIYKSIANWSVGKSVLDAGCGIGIGTNILHHAALGTLGIDLNQENVDVAKALYEGPKIKFETADLTQPPPRPIGTFDVVACIEVIEHVTDYDAVIEQLKRYGSPERRTVWFISSPNRLNKKLAKDHPRNEYHVREWTAGEFYGVLTRHFQHVTLYAANGLGDIFDSSNLVDGNTPRTPIVAKCEAPVFTASTGDL